MSNDSSVERFTKSKVLELDVAPELPPQIIAAKFIVTHFNRQIRDYYFPDANSSALSNENTTRLPVPKPRSLSPLEVSCYDLALKVFRDYLSGEQQFMNTFVARKEICENLETEEDSENPMKPPDTNTNRKKPKNVSNRKST